MDPDMKRVRVLRNRLRYALKKEHPINTIPAMQTYTVEEMIRISPNYEAAVAGLQAIHNDMVRFAHKCFHERANEKPKS